VPGTGVRPFVLISPVPYAVLMETPQPPPVPDLAAIAETLVQLGCPAEKSLEMAAQLHKRAGQLVIERGGTQEAALAHLLRLMAGGWAATARTQGTPPP
jgi:hypothetical protein